MKKITFRSVEKDIHVEQIVPDCEVEYLKNWYEDVVDVEVEDTFIKGTEKYDAYVIFRSKPRVDKDGKKLAEVLEVYAYSMEDAQDRLRSLFPEIDILALVNKTQNIKRFTKELFYKK